ncbi:hypothetical protein [Massilia sp. Root335]|jgi:hypothetical protein|uniref:hypothetical protein n=1 Tax=Massilia sp. Root335 TaxID=1736517 RepID=UPI0006F7C67A|nr:hypothetical protein [Massilia sp. Root335]KQV46352.1 hypothetical protein ASC93_14570 [Massilia sp. Root335]
MSKKIDIPPAFINVIVIAVPTSDGSGNAADGLYNITTLPDAVAVTRPNTIVNFQLIPPTPDAFVFAGFERKPSVGVRQLSNASVSLDGKMLTFSDENSDKEFVGVTLLFSTGQGSVMHDPQIQNTPET